MSGPTPYAELHCHTSFSFLDGASHPDALVDEASRLGLSGLAITDHDGLYGAVQLAEAARACGLPTVFGAEITLGAKQAPSGKADPDGTHLVVLAEGPIGYARLARAISAAQFAGQKGIPNCSLDTLVDAATSPVHLHPHSSTHNESWFVLTGCRKGSVARALMEAGPAAAGIALDRLVEGFGRDRVLVELWDHGDPLDRPRNDALAEVSARAGVRVVATNNVHYASPRQRPLANALAAVRARRSLDSIDGWLPAGPIAHLRSGTEQALRFARYPGAIEATVELAASAAFDLRHASPNLPDYPVPEGHTEMSWLRSLALDGASVRYPPSHARHHDALQRINYELGLIEELGFAGYFLLVHDIVCFCIRHDIYCQGRGSAANSAVCYAIGITKADAVSLGLLFERFMSPARDGPPDIDIDIEHERREEVIQYVYEKYGRERAAQVANVITYRPRSALREMAKAYGFSPREADALAKKVDARHLSDMEEADVPAEILSLARQVEGYPRHLGIHSGGMVIADRPLVEYCPVEWARMPGRSVLQWDKDDCAAAGLVKFDLLGLGMLTMLHLGVDLVAKHRGIAIDLATIPQEEEPYDLLCAADTVGVFQVESRAQMATLPRLRPRCFYDLVIEVALIRPGPIQGDSVHPYLRRRNGEEPVTYLHPLLEPSLTKTLGIPLFQEQLMQMAIDVAGFTAAEADQLRSAMGSKRSHERMARLRVRLMEGMAERGVTKEAAEAIAGKLEAFADFGFPESHSVSFAYLVYASAWMKYHYPAEFTCALLNAQPMGFYEPHTIIRDARRHGVEVLGPDVNLSASDCRLTERSDGSQGQPRRGWHAEPTPLAVRIGLRYVRNLGAALLKRVEHERKQGAFDDMEDFARRTGSPVDTIEALAMAGAFGACSGLDRRSALWAAGALRNAGPGTLPGMVSGVEAPKLPGMSEEDELGADLWSMGLSPSLHPTELVREDLAARGVVAIEDLRSHPDRSVIEVAGVVTHRQRPSTAKGVVFVNLEDETGLLNVICTPDVWRRNRKVAGRSSALVVRGVLERKTGVTNLRAVKLTPLRIDTPQRSRDFR